MSDILRLPLDPNGHFLSHSDEKVSVILPEGKEPFIFGDVLYSCSRCGDHPRLTVTENAVKVENPCPYPNGITTEITLHVPSGKIIVADDLRPIYDGFNDTEFASYNSIFGQAQVVRAMADLGCAYGPVGNSCPGLYRTGKDTYIIASPRLDDNDVSSLPEEDCQATIITDLWAYSIADYEDWKSKGGDPASLDWSRTVMSVKPGTYKFTHHTGERDFDRDADDTVIFAHVERIES